MAEKVDQMDPDEKIVEIAIERLRVFENHPFRVEMDSQMKDLQDSIKKYGIITPVIVRPRKEILLENGLNFRQQRKNSKRYLKELELNQGHRMNTADIMRNGS